MEFQQFVSLAPWTMIFQIGNLALLVWLMKKLLFRPVQQILEKRQREIDGVYEAAQADRSSAAEMRAEYRRRIGSARAEADQLMRSAMDEAARRRDEIVEDAHRQAAQLRRKSGDEIERERERAWRELKGDASALALDIAERMLGREINGDDQAFMADDFIRNLGDEA